MRLLLFICSCCLLFVSCYKAHRCECTFNNIDSTSKVLFINGTKNDSQKACKNMADSIDHCLLKY
jgi:hypothetical protein